jgi:hypothetical protein
MRCLTLANDDRQKQKLWRTKYLVMIVGISLGECALAGGGEVRFDPAQSTRP